jgi:hypothetical protein
VCDPLPSGEDLDESSTESLVRDLDDLDVEMHTSEEQPVPVAKFKKTRKRTMTITAIAPSSDEDIVMMAPRPTTKHKNTKRAKTHNTTPASEIEYSDIDDGPVEARGPGGRPRKALVGEMWVEKRRKRDDKHVWVCIAIDSGCPQYFERRAPDRMLSHSRDCTFLKKASRVKVNQGMAEEAPSERLKALSSTTTATPAHRHSSSTRTLSIQAQPVITTSTNSTQPSVYAIAKKAGLQHRQTQLDADVTAVICACGIPPSIVDHPVWKRLIKNLAPDLKSPSASSVEDAYIPREASAAKLRKIKQLQQQRNLTISFDGGSMRSSQSSISYHVTQENGEVIFFECEDGSAHSHTAEFLFEFLDKVSPTCTCLF